jgi:hypothetical protein
MLTELDLNTEIAQQLTKETLTQTKIRSMFVMQNELNYLIDPTWYEGNKCDFNRAAMVELAELMDHYGYKWWKGQAPNADQCKLEVIDIAHFHISNLIKNAQQNESDIDLYLSELEENIQPIEVDKSPEAVRNLIDECIFLASSKNFTSKALGLLMSTFDLTIDELYEKYILKNTLNIFRNKNGYQAGTYKKIWDGKEDNEVLMDCFVVLNHESPSLAEDLYEMLEVAYKEVA